MRAAVQVNGLSTVTSALRKVGGRPLTDEIKQANLRGSEMVVRSALPNVPVRTGRLKSSVRALASQRSGRAVAGGARVPYAGAIHWGRKRGGRIVGRPFLWDAAQRVTPAVVAEYERALGRLVRRVMG